MFFLLDTARLLIYWIAYLSSLYQMCSIFMAEKLKVILYKQILEKPEVLERFLRGR